MLGLGVILRALQLAEATGLVTAPLALVMTLPTARADTILAGRAVLPAATFAEGPTSGQQLGAGPINGQNVPFVKKQPVQGFSAIHDNRDGTFMVVSDNGFGNIENSADYNLRVYRIRPDFKTRHGGTGGIHIEGFIELHDPDDHIPFAITNEFTEKRILTGADFDIESMQKTADGTLWFGDEFGPFLLHTDAKGRMLEPPIALPDFDHPGREIRSPRNPFNEEASAVRVMNAVRTHGRLNGNKKTPVFSPLESMLDDGNPNTFVASRNKPPVGSGLKPASSEIFDVRSLTNAGYPVVTWTVNDKPRMLELMKLRVNGIISDRPDLLRQAIEEFDANNDGVPGDFLDSEGLIDSAKFDAQGHRGGRSLRPENTFPALEVALDHLMSTLETDTGITADGVPVLDHDPYIEATKCRLATGGPYSPANQVLVKNQTAAEIQDFSTGFICDVLLAGRPDQTNDLLSSPVSVAFAASRGLQPYVKPTLQQLFDFVGFYVEYYRTGAGKDHPETQRRWKNAAKVRFNIETTINPRKEVDTRGNKFSDRTTDPEVFARAVAHVIVKNGMQDRADIQSFDFRTLLIVQAEFPQIRTVYLFGDFPVVADAATTGSSDGTNLQDQDCVNTPWLGGLFWPYRSTTVSDPFRARGSGGFEGMALTSDQRKLLPLLEQPLAGSDPKTLLIHEFDLETKKYTGQRYVYKLDARGTNIGDFVMLTDTPRPGHRARRDPG